MRSEIVTVNGKKVTVKEKRVIELRTEVAPKIFELFDGGLTGLDTADLIPALQEKVSEIFPELSPEDLDNCYPSEIEALVQAFINVNFGGLKKIIPKLSGLIKAGMSKLA
jgi:hypothetical protein